MRNLAPLATQLKQRGIPLGSYITHDLEMTDKGWTQNAVSHFTEIESALGIHPDRAIFQTLTSCTLYICCRKSQPGAFMNIRLSVCTSDILTHPDQGAATLCRQTH